MKPRRLILVLVSAFLVNFLLFTGLPNMLRKSAPIDDIEFIETVDFLRLPTERMPVQKPPQPDDSVPRSQNPLPKKQVAIVTPRRPETPLPEMPELAFDVQPEMSAGIPIAAPMVPASAKSTPAAGSAKMASPPVPMKDSYGLEEVDHPPRATGKARPLYPLRARRKDVEGKVDVKFLVEKTGQVSRVSVLRAEPPRIFDSSVIAAVSGWTFTPGRVDGKPVATWVTTTIEFKLNQK